MFQTDDGQADAPATTEPQPLFVLSPQSRQDVRRLLTQYLGGQEKVAALLREAGRENVRHKKSWLDLDPDVVEDLILQARTKCQEEQVTFKTAVIRRLDTALGAQDLCKPERPTWESDTPGTLGLAYEVKPSRVIAELTGQVTSELAPAPRKFVVGAEWQSAGGERVVIERLDGARYCLSSGEKLLAFELTRHFEYVGNLF